MSEITFNTDVFKTDNGEYDILIAAAKKIKNVEGTVVEIGTREGGSAKIIMDAIRQVDDTPRNMICIDPYGEIDWYLSNLCLSTFGVNVTGDENSKEELVKWPTDYTNEMRNIIIPSLYYYAYKNNFNFTFFCLEDTEFFDRYADGIPTYDRGKKLEDKYALVFFDGPHTTEAVKREVEFFLSRTVPGSVFVFDDTWVYSHVEVIELILFANNFRVLERGETKISYIKY